MALFKSKKKKAKAKHADNGTNSVVLVSHLKTLLDDIKTHGTADRPDTIAVRKSDGTLEVTDPVEPQDAVSKNFIKSVEKKTLLWENADPDSSFPSQSIPINWKDYKRLYIEFRGISYTQTSTIVAKMFCPNLTINTEDENAFWPASFINSYTSMTGATKSFTFNSRLIQLSSHGEFHLFFSACLSGVLSGAISTDEQNKALIPYRIYGIKEV